MVGAAKTGTASRRPRLCFITSLPYQVNVFLAEHIKELATRADILVITNGTPADLRPEIATAVRLHPVRIERPVSPARDLRALAAIVGILRTERPNLVQSMTAKAGLLGMLASWMVGIPARCHWFTGQVWQNRTGLMRHLLRSADRLTARLSTGTLVDSASQLDFLAKERIAPASRMRLLANGSVCGVDTRRFRPDATSRHAVRGALGLGDGHVVALFAGRLTPEKGLLELVAAVRELRDDIPNLHVVLVGFEEAGFLRRMLAEAGPTCDRLHVVGYSDAPERYMAAADFLVLPSHREGFGSTVIEAAACGIPAVGTRIHGLSDAIVDGRTGLLVEPRDSVGLASAMRRLAVDTELRTRLGEAALARACLDFGTALLTTALREYYDRSLGCQ